MVPRPGATGSEDGLQIKQEPDARAPTTDGSSPDTQIAMRPTPPQIHERTSVAPDIKVEAKEEYEKSTQFPMCQKDDPSTSSRRTLKTAFTEPDDGRAHTDAAAQGKRYLLLPRGKRLVGGRCGAGDGGAAGSFRVFDTRGKGRGLLKVGKPDYLPLEMAIREQERLRQIIWLWKHLVVGKENALPPPAVGVKCDIDIGDAKSVAQRCRKTPPPFREKVFELIKGLLSAKMIKPSTSPWASHVVVIIKSNGVDIWLCIDYRAVNELTQLMIYSMPPMDDLLEGLDAILWYCSLDIVEGGFWVGPMADRARLMSAFITPFGLFEWLRMPFGLRNAPQICQRLIDDTLYGFLMLSRQDSRLDVFKHVEPESDDCESILGRRSYIDDILVGAASWDDLCVKVENLLAACDQ